MVDALGGALCGAAALLPGLYLQRVSLASLRRARDAWLVGLVALGALAVGWREPWLGVIGAYLWAWWLDAPVRDPLGRAGWEKARTLVVWAALAGTWFLALELPAWGWAWLPTIWGVWAWGLSAAMAWQVYWHDPAKVRGWLAMRSVAGALLALFLPLLPLWAWPGPLVGLWLSGPSWAAVAALAAASAWRWPAVAAWGALALAATGVTLAIWTACRPRVGAHRASRLPDCTSPPGMEASHAVKRGDRDDTAVGPGGAGGPYLVERPDDAAEARQAGLRGNSPGVLQRAVGALSLGAQATGGARPEWWATLWSRPLELTPRGDSLDSVYQRLALLRLAWQDRSWGGTGPGTTPMRHLRAAARGELAEATGTVHCEPVQLVAEYGLAGALALGLFAWRVGSRLTLGDPWSSCVVAGAVLACGTMTLRVAPIGLIFLLACAEVSR